MVVVMGVLMLKMVLGIIVVSDRCIHIYGLPTARGWRGRSDYRGDGRARGAIFDARGSLIHACTSVVYTRQAVIDARARTRGCDGFGRICARSMPTSSIGGQASIFCCKERNGLITSVRRLLELQKGWSSNPSRIPYRLSNSSERNFKNRSDEINRIEISFKSPPQPSLAVWAVRGISGHTNTR